MTAANASNTNFDFMSDCAEIAASFGQIQVPANMTSIILPAAETLG
jgi:hypothetical protein